MQATVASDVPCPKEDFSAALIAASEPGADVSGTVVVPDGTDSAPPGAMVDAESVDVPLGDTDVAPPAVGPTVVDDVEDEPQAATRARPPMSRSRRRTRTPWEWK
jgi:hypothetical protein